MSKLTILLAVLACCSFSSAQFTATQLANNDLLVAQFSAFVESVAAGSYNLGLSRFSQADFQAAGYNASVYNYIQLIGLHENTHYAFWRDQTLNAGGTVLPNCTLNVTKFATVRDFLVTGRFLENTIDVLAYNGGAGLINSRSLLTTAATIATIETRHAAFLNELLGDLSPFPNTRDTGADPLTVLQTANASGLIVSCPVFPQQLAQALQLTATSVNEVRFPNATVTAAGNYIVDNDINALNYALFLEYLEATFYTQFLQLFNAAAFSNAGYDNTVYNYFVMIRDQENAHVTYLQGAIAAAGYTALPRCANFNFNTSMFGALTSVQQYVSLAQMFENVGVYAYNGGIAALNNRLNAAAAASIATVESRHAAFLNQLVGVGPFNASSFDGTLSPTQVFAAVAPFAAACPVTTLPNPLPQVLVVSPAGAAGTTIAPGGSTTVAPGGSTTPSSSSSTTPSGSSSTAAPTGTTSPTLSTAAASSTLSPDSNPASSLAFVGGCLILAMACIAALLL